MKTEFDKRIYSEKAVRQAIKDYASIADIEMINTPERCVCSINRSALPIETTLLEFSNYVLNLSVMSEKKV